MNIKPWASPHTQECTLGRHTWSVPRLFELARDLPVLEIPLDHLCVNYSFTHSNPNLRELVRHMRAVHEADLDCPIILDEDGELMDGRHRIMKAMFLNLPTIKAVRFQENPPPDKVSD